MQTILARRLGAVLAACVILSGCQARDAAGESGPYASPAVSEKAAHASLASESASGNPSSQAPPAASPLYFTSSDPGGTYFHRSDDGGDTWTELAIDGMEPIVERVSERIYYSRYNRENPQENGVYSCAPDGSDETRILDAARKFTIVGDTLYYEPDSEPRAIWRAGLDGSNARPVMEGLLGAQGSWYIAGGAVYYSYSDDPSPQNFSDYNQIYSFDISTGEAALLFEQPGQQYLVPRALWGGRLVCTELYAGTDASILWYDPASGETGSLPTESPKMIVSGETIYFAGNGEARGILALDSPDDAPRAVYDGDCGHFAALDGALYVCPDDSFTDWSRLDLGTGEVRPLPNCPYGWPVVRSQPDRQPDNLFLY